MILTVNSLIKRCIEDIINEKETNNDKLVSAYDLLLIGKERYLSQRVFLNELVKKIGIDGIKEIYFSKGKNGSDIDITIKLDKARSKLRTLDGSNTLLIRHDNAGIELLSSGIYTNDDEKVINDFIESFIHYSGDFSYASLCGISNNFEIEPIFNTVDQNFQIFCKNNKLIVTLSGTLGKTDKFFNLCHYYRQRLLQNALDIGTEEGIFCLDTNVYGLKNVFTIPSSTYYQDGEICDPVITFLKNLKVQYHNLPEYLQIEVCNAKTKRRKR